MPDDRDELSYGPRDSVEKVQREIESGRIERGEEIRWKPMRRPNLLDLVAKAAAGRTLPSPGAEVVSALLDEIEKYRSAATVQVQLMESMRKRAEAAEADMIAERERCIRIVQECDSLGNWTGDIVEAEIRGLSSWMDLPQYAGFYRGDPVQPRVTERIEQAISAERERCAKIAEDCWQRTETCGFEKYQSIRMRNGRLIAHLIREKK